MELYHAIKELFPQAETPRDFLLQDDGQGAYIKEWRVKDSSGNPIPRPTRTELEAAYKSYLDKKALTEYRRLRAREYPSIGDPLDTLWKALKGMGLVADATLDGNTPEGMLARVEAVKNKYPKL